MALKDDMERRAAIDRFWDQVIQGHADAVGDLDPADAATIRYLHGSDDRPAPSPGFRRHLREDLMYAHAIQVSNEPSSRPSVNGRAFLPLPVNPSMPPSAARNGGLAHLATAALLLVTVVASFFAFGPGRSGGRGSGPASLVAPSAISATPSSVSSAVVEFLWQSRGGPDLPLHDPVQVAKDPQGNIWVTDGRNSRYQIFSPDGEFLEAWGTTGSAPGQFNFVVAPEHGGFVGGSMAFDPAGNLYVVDSGNSRIQKFGPDRTFLTTWGSEGEGDGQFIAPTGVAIDQQGRIYVAEEGRDDVQVFNSDGRFLTAWGDPDEGWLDDPSGIAVDAEGNLWIAHLGSNRVQNYAPDGTLLAAIGEVENSLGQLRYPSGVAIDEQGRLYVSNWGGGHVLVFDAAGKFLARWGEYGFRDGEVTATNGVLLDGLGNVYIAEDGNDRLLKFRLLSPLT